ncbi:MAG: hypothetical protein GYB31_08965 [Bacteroidetes bacterium]|nr:hypothetical protein [Bacteroidota bacterium]
MQDPLSDELKVVVIDPGHGGHDPGCSGSHSREKHIALAISKLMAESLRAKYPNLKVILTRETDVFIPLHERAAIANRNKADLFISVHCNYFPHSLRVNGSETYVLGMHRKEENLNVAKRENASIYMEDNYEANYDYDPDSPEGHIMISMFQNAYLDRSIRFAELVEERMFIDTRRKSRGVRQAGFLVLRATAMPSVLIETGYLSNSKDEDYLYSPEGQQQIAHSLVRAFSHYKSEVEGTPKENFEPLWQEAARIAAPETAAPTPAPEPVKSETAPPIVEQPVDLPDPSFPEESGTESVSTIPEKPVATEKAQVQLRIQLAASPRPLNVSTEQWNAVPYQVQVVEEGNYFKYQALAFTNLQQARAALSLLKDIGFSDAFIVAYEGHKKITVKEAVDLLSEEIRP